MFHNGCSSDKQKTSTVTAAEVIIPFVERADSGEPHRRFHGFGHNADVNGMFSTICKRGYILSSGFEVQRDLIKKSLCLNHRHYPDERRTDNMLHEIIQVNTLFGRFISG